MEHIVQFGISIDDQRIKEVIEAKAEKQIMETLTDDVRKQIFQVDRWSKKVTDHPSIFMEKKIDKFLEDNRDAILELTAKHLAEKLVRTKKGKALLEGEQ